MPGHWSDNLPLEASEADTLSTEDLVKRVLADKNPPVSALRMAVANRLAQLDAAKAIVNPPHIDDMPNDAILLLTGYDPEIHNPAVRVKEIAAAVGGVSVSQTSPEISTLAAKVLAGSHKPSPEEIRSMAASLLRQDETRGQS